MIKPQVIDIDGKQVVIKLMDDLWTFNQCVSAHPMKPRAGVVWSHHDHCSRLPVPGDELPHFMSEMRGSYGNCAILVWQGEILLGHTVFLPKAVARDHKATGWERFGDPKSDEGTLVVINVALCSLSGHEFRRKGIGRALVEMMCEWARQNCWKRIEVYDTAGGLFPLDWFDHCIPPRPFWESRGFNVFAKHGNGKFTEDYLQTVMKDNPRDSDLEQREKREIIEKLRNGEINQEEYAFQFDLRVEL